MISRKITCFVTMVVLLSFISCGNNAVYEEVRSVPSGGWNFNERIGFEYVISDINSAYDVQLHIRNTKGYSYSNLWLFIDTKSPDGKVQHDTLEIALADERGNWLGKSKQSINSMLVPYRQNVKFPARGIYTTTIQHAMRDTTLSHLIDVGIRIDYHSQK